MFDTFRHTWAGESYSAIGCNCVPPSHPRGQHGQEAESCKNDEEENDEAGEGLLEPKEGREENLDDEARQAQGEEGALVDNLRKKAPGFNFGRLNIARSANEQRESPAPRLVFTHKTSGDQSPAVHQHEEEQLERQRHRDR
jgi:hypothetical protein